MGGFIFPIDGNICKTLREIFPLSCQLDTSHRHKLLTYWGGQGRAQDDARRYGNLSLSKIEKIFVPRCCCDSTSCILPTALLPNGEGCLSLEHAGMEPGGEKHRERRKTGKKGGREGGREEGKEERKKRGEERRRREEKRREEKRREEKRREEKRREEKRRRDEEGKGTSFYLLPMNLKTQI